MEKAQILSNMASVHIVFERGAPLTLRLSQVSFMLNSRNAYLKNESRDSLVNPRTTSASRTKHCSLLPLWCHVKRIHFALIRDPFHPVLSSQRAQKHACHLWRSVSVMSIN